MKNKITAAFIAILALAGLAAGQEYRRIVSLGPDATENLWLLGVGDRVVGVTVHDAPEKKQGREIIGTLLEPNIERIVQLNPDLVVTHKEGNRAESVRKLEKLGKKVLVLDGYRTYEDVCGNFLQLGRVLNREKEAEKVVAAAKQRLAALGKKYRSGSRPKVFFCIGLRPLFTVGGDSYIDEIIEAAGGENIFGAMPMKYPNISREDLTRKDPDVIVLTAMGMDKDAGAAVRKRWASLKAVRSGRFFYVSDTLYCSPTPVSFVNAVEKLGELFHTHP